MSMGILALLWLAGSTQTPGLAAKTLPSESSSENSVSKNRSETREFVNLICSMRCETSIEISTKYLAGFVGDGAVFKWSHGVTNYNDLRESKSIDYPIETFDRVSVEDFHSTELRKNCAALADTEYVRRGTDQGIDDNLVGINTVSVLGIGEVTCHEVKKAVTKVIVPASTTIIYGAIAITMLKVGLIKPEGEGDFVRFGMNSMVHPETFTQLKKGTRVRYTISSSSFEKTVALRDVEIVPELPAAGG